MHSLGMFVSVSFALSSFGCGDKHVDGRPQPVPVSGTVIFEGKPIEGAKIAFAPQDHQYAAAARTDAAGNFKLQTFEVGDGAVPGKFRVVVFKADVFDLPNGGYREEHHLPARYRNAETTPLESVVSADQKNEIRLELTK